MTRHVGRYLSDRWNSTPTTYAPLAGEGKVGREAQPDKNTSRFVTGPLQSAESDSRRGRFGRVPQQDSMHAHTTGRTVAPRQPTRVGRPRNHRGDGTAQTAAQTRDEKAETDDNETERTPLNPLSRAKGGFFFRATHEGVPAGDDRTTRTQETAGRRRPNRPNLARSIVGSYATTTTTVAKVVKVGGVRPPRCCHFGNSGFSGGVAS